MILQFFPDPPEATSGKTPFLLLLIFLAFPICSSGAGYRQKLSSDGLAPFFSATFTLLIFMSVYYTNYHTTINT